MSVVLIVLLTCKSEVYTMAQKGFKLADGGKMVIENDGYNVKVSVKTPAAKKWQIAKGKVSYRTTSDRIADILAYNSLRKAYGVNTRGPKTTSYDWVKLAKKLAGGLSEDAKVKI